MTTPPAKLRIGEAGKTTGRGLLAGLLLAGLIAAAFAGVWNHNFVNWDDNYILTENEAYRGLSAEHLQWMWETRLLGHFQPLTWLTYAVDHTLWGMNPRGYLLQNLIWHWLGAWFFFWIASQWFRWAGQTKEHAWALGLAVAALWAIHPLRVESVAWATERRDVLSGAWLLAAVAFWLKGEASSKGLGWRVCAMFAFSLSLLAKAWGITLPVVIVLMGFTRIASESLHWRSALPPCLRWSMKRSPWLALMAIMAAFAASQAFHAQAATAMLDTGYHPWPARIAQAFYGIGFYVGKTLLPLGLSPLYYLPEGFPGSLFGQVWPAFLATALLSLGMLGLGWQRPVIAGAWLIYIVVASPILGLAQSGPQLAADRYSYLATLPFYLLQGGGIIWLIHRTAKFQHLIWAGGKLLWLAVLGVFLWMTPRQVEAWRDSESLWQQVKLIEPTNPIAWNNRGRLWQDEGQLREAKKAYLNALRYDPDYGHAWENLGTLLVSEGRFQEAEQAFQEALQLHPGDPGTITGLAMIALSQGNRQKAVDLLDQVEVKSPGADYWSAKGSVALASGEKEEAIVFFEKAIRVSPDLPQAHYNLGVALTQVGQTGAAERAYNMAIQLNPRYAKAWNNLGSIKRNRGELNAASIAFAKALDSDPTFLTARLNRAMVWQAQGRGDEARLELEALLNATSTDWPFRRLAEDALRRINP